MGNDSSDSLCENEFNYGVFGYMFEPTGYDDDTADHVSRAGDAGDSEDPAAIISLNTDSSLRYDGLVGDESARLNEMLDRTVACCLIS